ncbi:copper chaperone CopZ [Bacillus fengqiuensis]|nr:copper chaperone CopZ [Bacillus fengqiuensis]
MMETTFFVKEAISEQPIMDIEQILFKMNGVERVLVDTTDGEVKVEFDNKKISRERIVITLQQHNFYIQ